MYLEANTSSVDASIARVCFGIQNVKIHDFRRKYFVTSTFFIAWTWRENMNVEREMEET
ncbi:hypothetical protein Fmac_031058 [Flemingia macrophylla]|uniref:Uncharacterized protein n=1 Tax=Flemingia macrophylla TaxID=520843 RepID=A0ABD1L106_9FABA